MPKTHAIVAAPFIAYGLVHFFVWFIGVISVPVLMIVKIVGRYKFGKAIAITLAILALFGITAFVLTKVINPAKETATIESKVSGAPLRIKGQSDMPADYVETAPIPRNMILAVDLKEVFFKLLVIFTAVSFIPNLIGVALVNAKLKKWNKLQVFIISLSFAIILSGIASLILILLQN